MIERGTGKIVNIGSVQSQLARPSIAAYSATKGGVVMLTKGLCADLAPFGIQVNAIAPGYFATQLTQALVEDEEFSAWVRARTPAGRWGQSEDLAGASAVPGVRRICVRQRSGSVRRRWHDRRHLGHNASEVGLWTFRIPRWL